MIQILDRFGQELSERTGLTWRVAGKAIKVDPVVDGGFPVTLSAGSGDYTVSFGPWHEHFDCADSALSCARFGVFGNCRVICVFRGRTPVRATLQYHDGSDWCDDSTTGAILVPFWRPQHVRILQNYSGP